MFADLSSANSNTKSVNHTVIKCKPNQNESNEKYTKFCVDEISRIQNHFKINLKIVDHNL